MQTDATLKSEIDRQLEVLWPDRYRRYLLSSFALLLTTIYLPLPIVLACIFINIALEIVSMRLMRNFEGNRQSLRHRAILGLTFFSEMSYAAVCALVWQHPENFGQALAVGMITVQMLQLAVLRSIHLQSGQCGLAGLTLAGIIGNGWFWLHQGPAGMGMFAISAAAMIGVTYTLLAMRANYRMHRSAATDRTAALAGDQAKSRFLAQMSHELRTPLNAILGMGHAELRRNKDALSQKRLSVLIASAEGLSTILDDILDMSAVQVGRLPIRSRPAIPRDEILASLGLFQPGIDAANLQLKVRMDPHLSNVALFDTQRARQCLSNLMSNALKHTRKGEIRVTAERIQNSLGENLLQIEVADTGAGIPDELHNSVFEPFFLNQNGKAGKDGYATESNGLGLSICRAMARQMGGDLILAPNAPNGTDAAGTQRGASFILTMRLGVAPDAAGGPAPSGQPEEAPAQPVPGLKAGLKVLVVDDIATNRLVASTYLRMIGATITEAESGDAALQRIAEELPDLVLLDMNMPGMSGLETLQRIRELPGASGKLPVVAMTADQKERHQELYRENGLDGYLAKPINPTRIESEIRVVMERTRTRGQAPRS